jgi:hypothetical protein
MYNNIMKPKTVKEAVSSIIKRMTNEEKEMLKSISQGDTIQFHHTVGRFIRNDMGLWGKNISLLRDCNRVQEQEYPEDYKQCQDLYATYEEKLEYPIHPDDASGVILDEVWRYLNGGLKCKKPRVTLINSKNSKNSNDSKTLSSTTIMTIKYQK